MSTWKDLSEQYERELQDTSEVSNNTNDEINSQGDNANDVKLNYFELANVIATATRVCTEIILPHPLITIRRQCQITNVPYRYHWTPFSVIPVVFKLVRCQGFQSLWKGIGSSLCFWLTTSSVESIIGDTFNLPKKVTKHSSVKKMSQHLILKSVSAALMAPFYAACLVQTVQSDLAGDSSNVLCLFTDGLKRLATTRHEPVSHLLPVWKIVPAISSYIVLHYVVRSVAHFLVYRFLSSNQRESSAVTTAATTAGGDSEPELEDAYHRHLQQLTASIAGVGMADAVLYPLELLVNRLCVQGTRILIDNVDKPHQMLAVTYSYQGLFHAASVVSSASTATPQPHDSVFRGFGALLLQYGSEMLLLYGAHRLCDYLLLERQHRSQQERPHYGSSHEVLQADVSPKRRPYQH